MRSTGESVCQLPQSVRTLLLSVSESFVSMMQFSGNCSAIMRMNVGFRIKLLAKGKLQGLPSPDLRVAKSLRGPVQVGYHWLITYSISGTDQVHLPVCHFYNCAINSRCQMLLASTTINRNQCTNLTP